MTVVVRDRAQILLAEDDRSIADIVSLILNDKYEMTIPEDYSNLRMLIKNNKYDLVLLDLSLWGQDGAQFCKEIKFDSINKKTPVILLSANSNARLIANSAGADGVIEKPFELDTLVNTIDKFLPVSFV